MTPQLKSLIQTKLQAIRIAKSIELGKSAFSQKLNAYKNMSFDKQQLEGIYGYLRELRTEIDNALMDREE